MTNFHHVANYTRSLLSRGVSRFKINREKAEILKLSPSRRLSDGMNVF